MNANAHPVEKSRQGDYVVRRPRSTDALGHSLRGAFGSSDMPDDFAMLLKRIDRATH
ncbi:MAG: hypothetical protein NDI74_01245 [Sphingomonas sp.]|mgnify:FL=1|jgi:hypothetical protein|uniref:hypothetical protein n=1 Tax=Sphingomonas TaxID=13687 RepID=UPI00036B8CF5|nr:MULTISPECIES: hypothetical protein [Sphingomonas]MBX8843731.1 hypothetical protein [Sphingomonas melonis]MBX8853353.1 hypothetical protein [Sphingomonas melonis]MBX8898306.1 hypothetical protein [Sphingomonas melonis]MCI4655519.1 hypothetical protein [Sphingomonas aquatilis]MCM2298028.1 hypothetical protein [Sphingomonas sp.]